MMKVFFVLFLFLFSFKICANEFPGNHLSKEKVTVFSFSIPLSINNIKHNDLSKPIIQVGFDGGMFYALVIAAGVILLCAIGFVTMCIGIPFFAYGLYYYVNTNYLEYYRSFVIGGAIPSGLGLLLFSIPGGLILGFLGASSYNDFMHKEKTKKEEMEKSKIRIPDDIDEYNIKREEAGLIPVNKNRVIDFKIISDYLIEKGDERYLNQYYSVLNKEGKAVFFKNIVRNKKLQIISENDCYRSGMIYEKKINPEETFTRHEYFNVEYDYLKEEYSLTYYGFDKEIIQYFYENNKNDLINSDSFYRFKTYNKKMVKDLVEIVKIKWGFSDFVTTPQISQP